MVRAPCCDKMGLKKGPWSSEEDQVLVSFIQQNGHANWRALPKLAGLQRCGKSCRLRWTNYLRPDIKRGNFSKEEEETIFQLHEMLGNRWSAIAAKLPGRTDNEIKNVWHTHLKKKLKSYQTPQDSKRQPMSKSTRCESDSETRSQPENPSTSPPRSTSELSSVTDLSVVAGVIKEEQMDSNDQIIFPEIDESFWSEDLADEDSKMYDSELLRLSEDVLQAQRVSTGEVDDGMEFWYNLFIGAGELPELPEF